MGVNNFASIGLPINMQLSATATKYIPGFDYALAGEAYDYYWIFVLGAIFAFSMAVGIGANDVANSFATSVGSKTLKMWQAVVIAGLCEFFGAYLMGSRVTSTIKDGIIDINAFKQHDDLLMFGMLCALISATSWLAFATYWEFPVSTTHSIIGAVIGYGLCISGGGGVNGPGVGLVVAAWFVSPALSGTFAAILFFFVRRFILRHENAYNRVFLFFPVLVFITFVINIIFILQKGGVYKGQGLGKFSFDLGVMLGLAFGIAAGLALLTIVLFNPLIRRTINNYSEERMNARYAEVTGEPVAGDVTIAQVEDAKPVEDGDKVVAVVPTPAADGKIEAGMDRIFHQQYIHSSVVTNKTVNKVHGNAEKFPIKAEIAFGFLQVFTACFASFAHGANDVANAIGPFAAINAVWEEGVGAAASKSPVADWILIMGGAGIVVGLALFGHIIIAAMGVKLVKITPSRGFCMELSTAFVIMLGSFLGLPLSSTQVATGAIVGVALLEGNAKDAVNWYYLAYIFMGWVLTLVLNLAFSAALFSFGTYAPAQIYPLSAHNCIHEYGHLYNTSNGDLPTYSQTVDAQGTIAGLYGFPVSGGIVEHL